MAATLERQLLQTEGFKAGFDFALSPPYAGVSLWWLMMMVVPHYVDLKVTSEVKIEVLLLGLYWASTSANLAKNSALAAATSAESAR